ncbi:MAG: class I SAM-dependent DNA methyltransferase, partial [Gammaproteobacteria bacterium]|nr:class I SAM-dependent DNA methyltransferase [Gammaproteobacteria bacterium]
VNGGLFGQTIQSPKFTRKSRQAILNSGEMNWAEINPDIFGSMIQAVITPEHRGGLGMHYTSVPNIMKVIEPLFLNDLNEQFEKAQGNKNKLDNLLQRIYNLKIFDPACGSGNFLIIAYKNLCLLEIKLFQAIEKASGNQVVTPFSGIKLSQFYGIELDDFAHEIAILSLWLTEHQMNNEFLKIFGQANPTLPLKQAGKIVQGNACRLDWEDVCPKGEGDEIYILGNPPYLGFSLQNSDQKKDIHYVFRLRTNFKRLDYICCWFQLAAKYIQNHRNYKAALVSTNSITQGEQVSLLWPHILSKGIEIGFAHRSFKWNNSAKSNAAVICIIVGIRNVTESQKYIFESHSKLLVKNINPYLLNGPNIIVCKRNKPLSNINHMIRGDMPIDGGNLIISTIEEKFNLIQDNPQIEIFIREFVGAVEVMNNTNRWCLWFKKNELSIAESFPNVKKRLDRVRIMRSNSTNKSTKKLAESPHLFGQIRHIETNSIIIPSTTSERREYIPLGFMKASTIISNLAYLVPCEDASLFGIISSNMHMVWAKTTCGRLKFDYRYSANLCYNTFPFPNISKQRKDEITQCVFRIIDERQNHPEKTMAQLYDPDKMPDGLREAHRLNDLAIERCYRSKPFESDEERLEYLFKLYEKMIAAEQAEQDIFSK